MRHFFLLALLLLAPAAYASATDHSGHVGHEMSAPVAIRDPNDENKQLLDSVVTPAQDQTGAPVTTTEELPPPSTEPTELVPQPAASMPEMDHSTHDSQGSHSSHDMTPLSIDGLPVAAADRLGGSLLESEDMDGLRVFKLTADEIAWPITDSVKVHAYAYNGQVPGPMIRVKAGEKIRILFTNNLAEPSTIHWHGVDVPIEMDGVPGISQDPVKPGETFTYEFTVPNTPGTFFYHTHVMPDKQQALGLSGAFIIDPATPPARKAWDSEYTLVLGEWTIKDGGNLPSMPMEGMFPNYFTINGKSWPDTQRISAKVGERILLRIVNAGAFAHPVHVHGAPFKVIASDGHPIPATAQLTKDTIQVAPGERYDLLWTPTRPGAWLVHCHINHHTMNDGQEVEGMGGMALAIDVAP